ncbi:zinc protease [Methylohalomonas lacus]|uniref:Zinc protease n=1 Tax=Methylohalomonas lacus TaxID=398773 RepID=A0AAE3HL97_9GAMM|nr:pitrilysin family protein [Methylohalomonas lacus]MCS3903303.1 zinc protease [Methylohalomonas lacus]
MSTKHYLLTLVLLVTAPVLKATPDIQHWQTEHGVDVYFVAADEIPIVDIHVVFDAGSARDGDHAGVAGMALGMLADGADGMSANAISQAFESVGAEYGTSLDRDMASVKLRTLAEEEARTAAVDMLIKVLSEPDFPQSDFEREQQRSLVGLQAKKQKPGSVASDAFYAALYGDHPYAHPTSGTEDSIKALTPADLRAFHEKHYTASNATIAVVGALTRDEVEDLANRLVARLPAGESLPALADVPAATSSEERIEFPSSQTHILIGTPVVERKDPDYFPLYVGNHVLGGGGMVTRLFNSIREERGLSYSVYSYFYPLAKSGPFVAGLQTSTAQADAALEVLRNEIRDYIENGPTADELEASKQNITGGFPLRIDSNSSIVSYLAVIGFYDLPLDYLDKFNDRVEAVTREDIVDAFQRRLDVAEFDTIMVGRQPDDNADD